MSNEQEQDTQVQEDKTSKDNQTTETNEKDTPRS